MIVSGWNQAGYVTISNNEFDGVTKWSAGCNGKHYWALLLIGAKDHYTFVGNWLHDVSGRAPHIGTGDHESQIFFHAVNNYFQDVGGHAFDIDTNIWVLLEGNYFQDVVTPITPASGENGGAIYSLATVDEASACQDPLGYICESNRVAGSGAYTDFASQDVLTQGAKLKEYLVDHTPVADVPANVPANAGVGKI